MRLGWDQINTAFNTLYNLCIDHPLHSAPKGGHATFSANPKELLGRKRRKAKRGDIVTGTNALPQGARIDLWRHGGNGANVACEFRAVLRGESLDKCASS